MYAGVVISAHIQHSRIFTYGKSLVAVHALIGEGKQSDMQRVYIGLRQTTGGEVAIQQKWPGN